MTGKSEIRSRLSRQLSGQSMSFRQIVSIFMPVLVDQAFLVILNLLNTSMISSAGVAAISAVNMVDSLNMFLVNIFIAISTGGTVVVAQFKGVGNREMVSKAAAGSVSSAFLLALGVSVMVLTLREPLLMILFGKADAAVLANARIYIQGCAFSYCGIAIEEAVCGAFRGVGETKSSFALSLIMNLTYMLLNVLFITHLHMGIMGMVTSLNIARYFAAGIAVVFVALPNNSLHYRLKDTFHFDPAMLKKIFFIGVPFAAEQLFFQGGKILTQTFVVSMGTLALDANAVCGSITGLFLIPANALAITVITVVGQCIGRRDVADARKFIKNFIIIASLSIAVVGSLSMPFYSQLISIFNPPAQVIPIIKKILYVNLAAQILMWPISFVTPSALRAAGDSRFTSVMAMLSMWLFRVVMGYVFGVLLGMGIFGIWLAMELEWGVRGLIFTTRLRGDKWYRHKLV